jgi:hypothetical protein
MHDAIKFAAYVTTANKIACQQTFKTIKVRYRNGRDFSQSHHYSIGALSCECGLVMTEKKIIGGRKGNKQNRQNASLCTEKSGYSKTVLYNVHAVCLLA